MGFPLRDYTLQEVEDFRYRLRNVEWTQGETQSILRAQEDDIQRYITNELVLSKLDFSYWLRRYAFFLTDEKRLETLEPWPSQQLVLDAIAKQERSGQNKIKIILLKARQVGETAIWEALLSHMVMLNPSTQAVVASDHPDNTLKLFQVMMRIYDNLPGWMRPSRDAKVKATNLHFDKLDSDVIFGAGNQKTTLGQGVTVDLVHLTELSTWDPKNCMAIDADLMPAFDSSQKHHSLLGLESTGQGGTGNWFHDEFQAALEGKTEFEPIFVAWYMRPNRGMKANGITFNEVTLNMAERVKREMGIELSREQLAWYQVKRVAMEAKNELELFFQEYASTIEEAFQTGFKSAFSIETRDRVRNACRKPIEVYEVNVPAKKLRPVPLEEWVRDPNPKKADNRLILWETPKPPFIYTVGVDTSYGMAGKDSSAVEVMRVGNRWAPDEQVAEWRGTISPVDLGNVAWIVGHIYADKMLDLPAKMAIEVNPGSPGIVVQTELLKAGYPNFYVWRRPDHINGGWSNVVGWWTTPTTRPLLTEKGIQDIEKKNLLINSPWFVDEMASFVYHYSDAGNRKVEHAPGCHDDRIMALFIALYVAHESDTASVAEERIRLEEIKKASPKQIRQLNEIAATWIPGDSMEKEIEEIQEVFY